MGTLSNDVTRLCEQIKSMRQARHELGTALRSENRSRRSAVRRALTTLSAERADMARRTKADRTAFIAGLRRRVGDLRRQVSTDLMEARQAWLDLRASAGGNGARRAPESRMERAGSRPARAKERKEAFKPGKLRK